MAVVTIARIFVPLMLNMVDPDTCKGLLFALTKVSEFAGLILSPLALARSCEITVTVAPVSGSAEKEKGVPLSGLIVHCIRGVGSERVSVATLWATTLAWAVLSSTPVGEAALLGAGVALLTALAADFLGEVRHTGEI